MKDDCSVKVNLVDSKENKGSKLADKSVRAYLDVEKAKEMLGGGGGGDSSKLRVKVKVDYVPTMAAEIVDTTATGATGHVYSAASGISLEDADGAPVAIEDFVAAAKAGTLELISIEHLGAFVMNSGEDAVVLQDNPAFTPTKLSSSIVVNNRGEQGDMVMIGGLFWGGEFCLPYMLAYNVGGENPFLAAIGVIYQQ